MPKKKPFEEFAAAAREKFGDKFTYDRSTFKNMNSPTLMICPVHGKFEMTPKIHLGSKFGCPSCYHDSRAGVSRRLSKHGNWGRRWSKEKFLEAAHEKFGDRFTYGKMDYVDMKALVTITCNRHGDFMKSPSTFLRSAHGCLLCRNEHINNALRSKSKIADKEKFIALAREAHGDRYDYSKAEMKGTAEKVCITCKEHGDFWMRPYLHLRGEGCPECKRAGVFNCERRVGDLLAKKFPDIEFVHDMTQLWLKPFRYDWFSKYKKYIKQLKTVQGCLLFSILFTEDRICDAVT